MADLSTSFDPAAVATSSDASSDAKSRADAASDAASKALSKIAAQSAAWEVGSTLITQTITPGTSVAIDWALGKFASLLLDRATTTISGFSNGADGDRLILRVR